MLIKQSPFNPALLFRFKIASRMSAITTAMVAPVILLGWMLNNKFIMSIFPGLVPMNPMTAISFGFSGVSLWLLLDETNSETKHRWGTVLGGIVMAISILRLIGYCGWDLGIDQLVFKERLAGVAFGPNRMAPNTAAAFLLLGASLIMTDKKIGRNFWPSQLLAVVVFFISLLALTGYLFRIITFSQVLQYIPMSLHTALVFIAISLGVLSARPSLGWMAVVSSDTTGGLLSRIFLPSSIAICFLLGWLRLLGERMGLYNPTFGMSMMILLNMVLLDVVIISIAFFVYRRDLERFKFEEEERRSAERIQDLYNKAPCGYHSLNEQGVFDEINDTELAWLGYKREEIIGKKRIKELLSSSSVIIFEREFPVFKEKGKLTNVELVMARKDGTTFPVLLNATAIRDSQGRYVTSRSILYDITERKAAENQISILNFELAKRVKDLEMANREMEAFSYSVSHDLRAPLRHIIGFADLLKREKAAHLDEATNRHLKIISDSARQMGTLIDDLLSFSRMGRAEMLRTTVDLSHLAKDIVTRLQSEISDRQIEWKIDPLPVVHGDASMMRQVFENLIANAVKYTRPRSPAMIEIGCKQESTDQAVVYVRDNGVGFDMTYIDKLFGVFQRLHSSDEFEGTGIGLANVRRIIQRHGGQTWAESVVNAGATFYFSLPKN